MSALSNGGFCISWLYYTFYNDDTDFKEKTFLGSKSHKNPPSEVSRRGQFFIYLQGL